ncbi:hypothetical protein L4X63_20305 [Geomonas sp. Red32]|uniref:hypothetical protein n=1 Tax=Geomonas sp. Red32 TaxID=2912856 RepID=UPI00202CB222|nr:hypothetical protein [Geomonas sp. Red32]MCM0083929.1 hypothetical protein [Geomonas sp. Red32]
MAILDEIASVLEGAAVRKPEILLSCGFDLTKERRKGTRSKGAASDDSKEVQVDNAG